MLPVLLDLGFLKIYTQGVFLVLAFLWGSFLLWKEVKLTAYREEDVFDGLFFSLLGGLFFGRLTFVLFNYEQFGFDLMKFFLINGYPGIYPAGAICGFLISLYLFTLSKKISFNKVIDYIIPPLFLAIAIAKMGSFFSGSEIGSQTSFFLALKYQNLDGTRHLTALYESILFFLASFWSHQIVRDIRREKYHEGFNFLFFLWFYAFVTILFDSLKSFKTLFYSYSFDLIASSLILLTVSIYFIYYFRSLILNSLSGIFSFRRKKDK